MENNTFQPDLSKIGPDLAAALGKFQSECPAITYNKKVDYPSKAGRVKYSYATFDHLLATIRNPLEGNGLSFTQIINHDTSVTTVLMHKSGQTIHGTCKIPAQSDHPQAIGATISYAKRYGLSAILGVSAEEDDEQVATSPAGSSRNYRNGHTNGKAPAPKSNHPNPANSQAPPRSETKSTNGLDKNISDQITNARTPAELNTIYKEIKTSDMDPKLYLPLLNNRKQQLTNAN